MLKQGRTSDARKEMLGKKMITFLGGLPERTRKISEKYELHEISVIFRADWNDPERNSDDIYLINYERNSKAAI